MIRFTSFFLLFGYQITKLGAIAPPGTGRDGVQIGAATNGDIFIAMMLSLFVVLPQASYKWLLGVTFLGCIAIGVWL